MDIETVTVPNFPYNDRIVGTILVSMSIVTLAWERNVKAKM